jgi:hypothetical protein
VTNDGRSILWGDGEHDDTEALQAIFDGREVIVKSSATVDLKVIKGLTAKSSETLIISRPDMPVSVMAQSIRDVLDKPREQA